MLRTRTLAIFSAIIFTIGTSCVWYYYKQKNQTAETMEKRYLGKRDKRHDRQPKPDDIAKNNQPPAVEEESTWEEGINPVTDQNQEAVTDVSENDQLDDIYFDFDESRIKAAELKKLEKLANYMLNHQEHHVLIEGHCDERGSDEYNRALGERRAIAVKFYLTELGVNQNRIHTLSLGEELAKQSTDDLSEHQQFRKAVTKLIVNESQTEK